MKIRTTIPSYVQKVARSLIKEGFDVYLVGGAVRDLMLNREPNDYDLATNALPDEMLEIFPKSVSVGAKFGTILALVKDSKGEHQEVEVTTFRSESDYTDGRWPTKVEFVEEIDKDLGRRDFTINAMALDLSTGNLDEEVEQEWEVYDPFNGITDLNLKIVRAVGTPIERFKEDGLRAYKACRLASQLEFEIEEDTFEAIKDAIPVAKQVSMERVRDEFMKMLIKSPKPSVGIELMRESGLLALFLPELLEGMDVSQKLYHAHDVYNHNLKSCDYAEDSVKLAALLHDIAKPRTDMGNGHFYGHDTMGAQMTEDIMKRLRFSKSEIERVKSLVKNHMFYYPHTDDEASREDIENVMFNQWSDSAVRRFLKRVGEDNVEDLFRLRLADATSNPESAFRPEEITKLQQHISKVRQEDMALKVSDLDISGNDLKEVGIEPGKRMGEILNSLLDMVIEDPLLNTKERLLEEVRKML